ncbi:hypothetical protein WJX72_008758 [[Myrmecia] bisecta]|uniref:PsbP C-terminal domain-containing protein n=1 Tax=[Myrmecia] bisecta TaxID=41462 RepID=A0AAW1R8I3_9CHLO
MLQQRLRRSRFESVRRPLCTASGTGGISDQPGHVAPSRRQLLAASMAVAAATLVGLGPQAAQAAEATAATQFGSLHNGTLAYEFQYPLQTAKGKSLPLIMSRKPERYSSAAPLSADARQRIVVEFVDIIDNVTVSMSVGPPSGVLNGREPQDWKPKEVANTVLTDRSTARITTGQRVSLNLVENATQEDREGTRYWVFEHISQGSPTLLNKEKESYRHAIAATSWRKGNNGVPYLYTVNMACPEELWPELEPMFQQAIASFRLTTPTREYVAPDEQPWRFF